MDYRNNKAKKVEEPSHSRVKLSFSAANGLVFALLAMNYSFISLYIGQFYTDRALGILLSVGPFVAIFSPIIWGILTDKAKHKNTILMMTIIGSAFFYTALRISDNFWYLFFILFGLTFFMAPFNGLIDAITLEYTSTHDIKYGPIRLYGTLGFGIISLLLTLFIKDNYDILFITYIVLAIAMCAAIYIMPKVKGHASDRTKLSIKPLFKDKRLMLYFAVLAVVELSFGFYLNFFPVYLIDTLKLPAWVWGVNVLLSVLPELPFFIGFNKIFDRFGSDKVFITALLLSIIRCLMFAITTNIWLILTTSLITGTCFAMIRYAVAVYINKYVAPELKASGQSFMQGFTSWLPRMLSGLIGGFLIASIGMTGGMFVHFILCVIVFFVFMFLKNKKIFIAKKDIAAK